MTDPLAIIADGCYLAWRFMLRASTTPTDSLETTHGCYGFRKEATTYHPLESVLVGEDVRRGDWKEDVAIKLGVSPAWIDGFIAGFAQGGGESTNQDYIQGYLTAEELRQRWAGLFRS